MGLTFSGFQRLRILDLSHNRLATVVRNEVKDIEASLEVLFIDNNQLKDINGAFDNMKMLERLTLAGNQLQFKSPNMELEKIYVPEDLFDKLDKLRYLDLSDNDFTYFPPKMAETFGHSNNLKVVINNNPYHCNYKIEPLYKFLNKEAQLGRCSAAIR
jgi:Leucine-rich repeat (LRR) protein